MRVAIGGSSGLIGSALVSALQAAGHEPLRLMRRTATGPDQRRWDPATRTIESPGLDDVDAVVNLAGAGIADRRWTESRKAELRSSRLDSTATVVDALTRTSRCKVFLSGSAIGYYGDTGTRKVDEDGPKGEGFLADLVADWEAAARPASTDATVAARTVLLRTGLVLAASGGVLGRQLPLFRFGLGGRLGSGTQYQPWISLTDEVAAILHLLTADVEGPVNLVGPEAVTNAGFARTLGRVLHRPALLPVPPFALALVLGRQTVDEALLSSGRIVPGRLPATGFDWAHKDLATALRAELDA